MSTDQRVEKLRRRRRSNIRHAQRNVIPSHKHVLEVTRLAKGKHSDVSNDDLDLSLFENPYIKILTRIGRHQPHCLLF